jgi:hypothetical protein
MTAWENKTKALKTDWTETKQCFEELVCNFEIYEQNSGGTLGKNKYESAKQATKAAKGKKIRHYTAAIVAAAVGKDKKQDKTATNICNTIQKKNNEMVMQLKMLSNAIAMLTRALANKDNNGGNVGGGGGSDGSSGSNGSSGRKKPQEKS